MKAEQQILKIDSTRKFETRTSKLLFSDSIYCICQGLTQSISPSSDLSFSKESISLYSIWQFPLSINFQPTQTLKTTQLHNLSHFFLSSKTTSNELSDSLNLNFSLLLELLICNNKTLFGFSRLAYQYSNT